MIKPLGSHLIIKLPFAFKRKLTGVLPSVDTVFAIIVHKSRRYLKTSIFVKVLITSQIGGKPFLIYSLFSVFTLLMRPISSDHICGLERSLLVLVLITMATTGKIRGDLKRSLRYIFTFRNKWTSSLLLLITDITMMIIFSQVFWLLQNK